MLDLRSSIEGKTALVTGGARGIGAATVEALLDHGAQVALTYNLSAAAAEKLCRCCPARLSAHRLDLRDGSSIAQCFCEVEARWGIPHVVVHNAAAGSATVTDYESDPGAIDQALFEINAIGAFEVCQRAVRTMARATDGKRRRLINVASVGGAQVFPSMRLADNMSKAALIYMSRQLAAELAQTDIDVFVLCPGATDTQMFRRSTLDKLSTAQRGRLLERLPKHRLITPAEVAAVIVFLASEHSTVLHGAVLDASMGLGVHPGLLTGKGS